MKAINRDELRIRLEHAPGRTILVDVRDKADFELEHIPGAISIPVEELQMRAVQYFGSADEIIVYCASFECQASTRAARILTGLGFANILDYEGGLIDWKTGGLRAEGTKTLAA